MKLVVAISGASGVRLAQKFINSLKDLLSENKAS